jgi:hypothetical protein
MESTEQYFSLVRTSKSSWVAVPVTRSGTSNDGTHYSRESEAAILRNSAPVPGRLFAQASRAHVAFSERHPRVTIAMIALVLFSVSVAVEVEMLLHAGYFWR